jgi:hypothetical protein
MLACMLRMTGVKGVQESENAGKHRAERDMTGKEDAQSPAQHHRIGSTT